MKLHYRAVARYEAADVFNFPLERLNVRRRYAVILCDHDVTRAKKAQAVAEGEMHVKGNRRVRRVRGGVILFKIVRPEIILPHRRGGIAGVARSRAIIFFEKLFGNFEAFPVQLKMEVRVAHIFWRAAGTARTRAAF
jgi:hypothetical protein